MSDNDRKKKALNEGEEDGEDDNWWDVDCDYSLNLGIVFDDPESLIYKKRKEKAENKPQQNYNTNPNTAQNLGLYIQRPKNIPVVHAGDTIGASFTGNRQTQKNNQLVIEATQNFDNSVQITLENAKKAVLDAERTLPENMRMLKSMYENANFSIIDSNTIGMSVINLDLFRSNMSREIFDYIQTYTRNRLRNNTVVIKYSEMAAEERKVYKSQDDRIKEMINRSSTIRTLIDKLGFRVVER